MVPIDILWTTAIAILAVSPFLYFDFMGGAYGSANLVEQISF